MLNKNQKIEFLKHLFLNSYLVNSDIMGEIFFSKEGSIVSLDYDDAWVDWIADFNYSEYESFLKLLLSLHNKTHAYIYQEHMIGLKETAC